MLVAVSLNRGWVRDKGPFLCGQFSGGRLWGWELFLDFTVARSQGTCKILEDKCGHRVKQQGTHFDVQCKIFDLFCVLKHVELRLADVCLMLSRGFKYSGRKPTWTSLPPIGTKVALCGASFAKGDSDTTSLCSIKFVLHWLARPRRELRIHYP